jgi:hypothetical protein
VQWLYCGAILAGTAALYFAVANYLPVRGFAGLRTRMQARLEKEGLTPEAWGGTFVGFSPAAYPRLYEGFFDWDVGYLVLAGDRLCHVGEQARFALRREQITAVYLASGPPSWFPRQGVYVAWRDEARGVSGTFNVRPGVVRSMRHLGREARALGERVQAWWREPVADPVPAPLEGLPPPSPAAVTSLSPRDAIRVRAVVNSLLVLLPVAAGVCVLLDLPFRWAEGGAAWFVLAAITLQAFVQPLPYWRYRDASGR